MSVESKSQYSNLRLTKVWKLEKIENCLKVTKIKMEEFFLCFNCDLKTKKAKRISDEDGIRTHACRAHWISSPTP